MARIETDPNYSAPTFSRATAATDLFRKEDVQQLAAAMSGHTHAPGKGLAIAAIAAGAVDASALASNAVTTIKIADGAVTSAKIADGTIVSDDLVAHAITASGIVFDGTAQSTTSTVVVPMPNMSVPMTTLMPNSDVLVFFTGTFSHGTAGAVQTFYLQQDSLGYTQLVRVSTPVANYVTPICMVGRFAVATAAAHTFNVGWATTGGTLVADTLALRYLVVMEFRR